MDRSLLLYAVVIGFLFNSLCPAFGEDACIYLLRPVSMAEAKRNGLTTTTDRDGIGKPTELEKMQGLKFFLKPGVAALLQTHITSPLELVAIFHADALDIRPTTNRGQAVELVMHVKNISKPEAEKWLQDNVIGLRGTVPSGFKFYDETLDRFDKISQEAEQKVLATNAAVESAEDEMRATAYAAAEAEQLVQRIERELDTTTKEPEARAEKLLSRVALSEMKALREKVEARTKQLKANLQTAEFNRDEANKKATAVKKKVESLKEEAKEARRISGNATRDLERALGHKYRDWKAMDEAIAVIQRVVNSGVRVVIIGSAKHSEVVKQLRDSGLEEGLIPDGSIYGENFPTFLVDDPRFSMAHILYLDGLGTVSDKPINRDKGSLMAEIAGTQKATCLVVSTATVARPDDISYRLPEIMYRNTDGLIADWGAAANFLEFVIAQRAAHHLDFLRPDMLTACI